ncbi:MAG: hypothetical protein K6C12_08360 [Oscillospiraceae bacterium]|nr:hypothetical protein [Oscillospiraceae bacterium]
MKNEIRIRHVIQGSLDLVFPLTMMYMCYIILHGHLSPGGGFQGGVLVVGVILMLYFANGYSDTVTALSAGLLHEAEGLASVAYVALALMGVAVGAQFCENILYTQGAIGQLYSSGTVFWMNLTVGIKVITGIGSITLLMLGVANQRNEVG